MIVPYDSATAVTRTRYRDYAASRHERTLRPQGPRRMLFAQDVTGTAEQILDQLSADPVLAQVSELRLELPYEFDRADYQQLPGVRRGRCDRQPHQQLPQHHLQSLPRIAPLRWQVRHTQTAGRRETRRPAVRTPA